MCGQEIPLGKAFLAIAIIMLNEAQDGETSIQSPSKQKSCAGFWQKERPPLIGKKERA